MKKKMYIQPITDHVEMEDQILRAGASVSSSEQHIEPKRSAAPRNSGGVGLPAM